MSTMLDMPPDDSVLCNIIMPQAGDDAPVRAMRLPESLTSVK
jgi:hypothetical protein